MKLPEKPQGWTKKMLFHLNLGEDGGLAHYEVFNERGEKAPFIWMYDTSRKLRGFWHRDHGKVMTWDELRAALEEKDAPA